MSSGVKRILWSGSSAKREKGFDREIHASPGTETLGGSGKGSAPNGPAVINRIFDRRAGAPSADHSTRGPAGTGGIIGQLYSSPPRNIGGSFGGAEVRVDRISSYWWQAILQPVPPPVSFPQKHFPFSEKRFKFLTHPCGLPQNGFKCSAYNSGRQHRGLWFQHGRLRRNQEAGDRYKILGGGGSCGTIHCELRFRVRGDKRLLG